jgi:glycosyltransferase involved in cell wall biosynthesis
VQIAHICEQFVTGGIESLLYDLCSALRKRDAKNHVLFLYGNNRNENINRGAFDAEPFRIGMYQRTRIDPAGLVRLRRVLHRLSPDVVHCHGYYAALAALLVRRTKIRIPILYTVHADIYRGLQQSDFLIQWVLRNCEKVTAVSEGTASSVAAFTNNVLRPKVVQNGVLLSRIRIVDKLSRTESRQACGVKSDSLIFTTVAALNKQKDHSSLFLAFAEAGQKLASAQLWVVGDGPSRGLLVELARKLGLNDRVRFWGRRDDVDKLLLATDVFVLASHNEGIPISVVEACCAGIPVIATDVGGLSDLREQGLGILLTPRKDVAQLRDALLRLANPVARRCLANTIATSARERFSIERTADEYLALYNQISLEMQGRTAA